MGCASSRMAPDDYERQMAQFKRNEEKQEAINNQSYWRKTNAISLDNENNKENIKNVINALGI